MIPSLLLAVTCSVAALPAAPTGPAAGQQAAALPAVEAPPTIERAKRQKLVRAVKRLRNSSAERRRETEQEIIAFGRAALPVLLDAAVTPHEGQQAGLVECLSELADARDRELAAAALTSPHPTLRRFGARFAGELGTEELLDAATALLDDDDQTARIEAALALVSRGRDSGLLPLIEVFDTGWHPDAEVSPHKQQPGQQPPESPWQARILEALPGVAGKGSHKRLTWRLTIDPQREQEEPAEAANERLAAVRMLHAIGDRASQRAIAGALDDPHNLVQRAAIDGLRDLAEDSGPFDGGSIFEQLNEVKRLKQLVGG